MSAVLVAVFKEHGSADRARLELVFDGFPTDRVELTASCEPGRAGLEPGDTLHTKFSNYFATVCSGDHGCAERLASALEDGAATVTVHPRGIIEVERAARILEGVGATEFITHDLENQPFEYAAAKYDRAWIQHLWVELPSDESHCIYCRLFERRAMNSA